MPGRAELFFVKAEPRAELFHLFGDTSELLQPTSPNLYFPTKRGSCRSASVSRLAMSGVSPQLLPPSTRRPASAVAMELVSAAAAGSTQSTLGLRPASEEETPARNSAGASSSGGWAKPAIRRSRSSAARLVRRVEPAYKKAGHKAALDTQSVTSESTTATSACSSPDGLALPRRRRDSDPAVLDLDSVSDPGSSGLEKIRTTVGAARASRSSCASSAPSAGADARDLATSRAKGDKAFAPPTRIRTTVMDALGPSGRIRTTIMVARDRSTGEAITDVSEVVLELVPEGKRIRHSHKSASPRTVLFSIKAEALQGCATASLRDAQVCFDDEKRQVFVRAVDMDGRVWVFRSTRLPGTILPEKCRFSVCPTGLELFIKVKTVEDSTQWVEGDVCFMRKDTDGASGSSADPGETSQSTGNTTATAQRLHGQVAGLKFM
eukprot:TRINITY_DN51625_c0_g1_i1.p1 TRINITY_DN51625_c0_g1~~TRINITY_DN51625_c0_g1_i1.p1  ORF type:complete len:436 (+),score=53.16 TRINITY_DN51625_c0_g1_i1:175-1482(+)